MSVRVQRYENLIKKWASPASFRVRHFNNFENELGIRFSLYPASRVVCFYVARSCVSMHAAYYHDDVFTSRVVTIHSESFFRSRHVACKT